MSKIKVLLVEDHTIMRQGLRSLLEGEPDIEVIGEAEDGREALRKVQQLQPDVVLMDIAMPNLNGLEATRQIKQQMPQTRVLVLTMHTNETYIRQILKAGASGYLVKRSALTELILAIQAVYRGETFLSSAVSQVVIENYLQQRGVADEPDSYDRLTNREREVLQLIAEGRTTREIAELLVISENTVRVHRAHLQEKLNLHSEAELAQYAIRKGIINPDD